MTFSLSATPALLTQDWSGSSRSGTHVRRSCAPTPAQGLCFSLKKGSTDTFFSWYWISTVSQEVDPLGPAQNVPGGAGELEGGGPGLLLPGLEHSQRSLGRRLT